MDNSLRQVCATIRELHSDVRHGRSGAREDFTEVCLKKIPSILDALESCEGAKHRDLTPIGISAHALENVNFFLWIAMRTLSYLAMILCFSIWLFTQIYASLTIAQTLCAVVFFVVQLIVTFPQSILYERKEMETVRQTRSQMARLATSLIMIAIAVFQFAILGYAVSHHIW